MTTYVINKYKIKYKTIELIKRYNSFIIYIHVMNEVKILLKNKNTMTI